jgi:tungstate transport system ATP-binding protein
MSTALTLVGEGLRRAYRRSGFALDVDRIEVPAGEILALLGPSGSGKSTLMHILGLLEHPDSGHVLLGGRKVAPGDSAARLAMAAVFQRPYLFKGTVAANVGYGLSLRGIRGAQRAERVSAALERVGLAGLENRGVGSLSGGEAQRISLARALVLEPQVLLLDEPLANLDALLRRRLTREFASILRSSGTTAVWVTHDTDEALTAADRIGVMNRGRLVAYGLAHEVSTLPTDEWTAGFLGLEAPQRGIVADSRDGLIAIDAGGPKRVFAAGSATPGQRVVFAVRPEDVLLFESGAGLGVASARNRLEAVVVSCERRGATDHVVLDADGVALAASVSRVSSAELSLAPGTRVLVVFKATAVRWRTNDIQDG